jgi:hypothetical protein
VKITRLLMFSFLAYICARTARAQAPCVQSGNMSFQAPSIGNISDRGNCLKADLNMLDVPPGGTSYLPIALSAPSITGDVNWVTANTASVTITNLLGGKPGQPIRLVCGPSDTFTTISSSPNITLTATWSCASSTSLALTLVGSMWVETGRGGSVTMTSSQYGVQTNGGSRGLASGVSEQAKAGTVANIFVKPHVADAVQYVTAEGNDSNDGLSWGTSKLTVLGACEGLPGGATTPATCGKGTIYFADNVYAQPRHTCGLWLMGPTDPNFASPSPCWIKVATISGFTLKLSGIPTSNYGPNPHAGRAALLGGSGTDINHPGIQISGVTAPLWFENISISYPGRGIVISQDSSGVYSGCSHAGSSSLFFDNVTVNLTSTVGNGPAWDIGGCTFWLWIVHSGASGLDNVNTPTNDNAAAILFRASTDGNSSGLVYIEDLNLAGGGIKYHTASSSLNSLSVKKVTTEGQNSPAAVWLVDGNTLGLYHFEEIQTSDPVGTLCQGTVCAVENDVTAMNPENVVVEGANILKGPMMLGGANNPSNLTGGIGPAQASSFNVVGTGLPFVNSQEGFLNGYVYANTDAARRLFGPTAVRFANLATTSPAGWDLPTGVTLTESVAAPDGTRGAGRVTDSLASSTGPYFYAAPGGSPTTIAVGDWLIAGVWSRYNSGAGWNGNVQGSIGVSNCTIKWSGTLSITGAPYDGNWVWGATAAKILTVSGNPCDLSFSGSLRASRADSADYYAPIFFRIPAGTMPDTEVQMVYRNLATYNSGCAVGVLCSPQGQSTLTIASGRATLGTSSINSNSCASIVTVSATGVLTTDTISWSLNADPNGVTGYGAGSTGPLSISAFPTVNKANFRVCNLSSGSITPGALTLNWRVVR